MHFLGGEREFISSDKADSSINDQIDNCIHKILQTYSPEDIYKLNFFVHTSNGDNYQKAHRYITEKADQLFGEKILINVISQAPFTRKVILEVFTYNPRKWNSRLCHHAFGRAIIFSFENTQFLLGSVHANGNSSCRNQAEKCFRAIDDLLSTSDFTTGDIIRQWNYIQDIIRLDGSNQNYQDFNDVRSKFYGNAFQKSGYPSATGIGMNEGGVIIEFIAMQSDVAVSKAVDNPAQIAAHSYSKDVLVGNSCNKTTPKFERARILQCYNRQMMFISGTASISGERTIGIDDPEEQTKVTISNIKKLYSPEVLNKKHIQTKRPVFNHCRVYIKNENDFNIIKKTCRHLFDDIPMVFIKANICRDQLLVEIEGEVIL